MKVTAEILALAHICGIELMAVNTSIPTRSVILARKSNVMGKTFSRWLSLDDDEESCRKLFRELMNDCRVFKADTGEEVFECLR